MELMLSEELLSQVDSISNSSQPKGVDRSLLDFDDSGNVHIRKRDGDGKLLEDIGIKENVIVTEQKSYYEEISEEYAGVLKKKDKAANRVNFFLGAVLIMAFIALMITIQISK